MSKRNRYSAKLKLSAVEYAETSNNCAAARQYGVTEKMIRDWRKSKDRLKEMPKSKYANRGLACKWPTLEEALFTWVEEKRKSGYMVTRNAIRLQARMAAIDRRIQDFRGTAS